jgi:hypothetical protein
MYLCGLLFVASMLVANWEFAVFRDSTPQFPAAHGLLGLVGLG